MTSAPQSSLISVGSIAEDEQSITDKYYPKSLKDNEIYWYLTEKGWIPWHHVDFSKMRVGVDIYMVVYSYMTAFLDPGSFCGGSKPVWTAWSCDYKFKLAAERLIAKYGAMPKDPAMFHKHFLVE